MNPTPRVVAIIPAFNEESSLPLVLGDLPDNIVDETIVVDNGSTDLTGQVAADAGAIVVREERRGYGSACLAGVERAVVEGADILLFLDADYSDHPEEAHLLIEPILQGRAELVIGSRSTGEREPGAMPPQAIFGNWLATGLIRLIWGVRYTDLGPFRAITLEAYNRLGMADRDFGWTVEMQARAAALDVDSLEVPVSYRRRVGVSKISGTIRGSIRAGYKILWTIARIALQGRASRNRKDQVVQ